MRLACSVEEVLQGRDLGPASQELRRDSIRMKKAARMEGTFSWHPVSSQKGKGSREIGDSNRERETVVELRPTFLQLGTGGD